MRVWCAGVVGGCMGVGECVVCGGSRWVHGCR